MKSEAQNQQDLFFFRANDGVAVRLEEQFKVRPEIIETENYVTESFIIHHYQILNQWNSHMDAKKKGEVWMRDFEVKTEDELKLLSPAGMNFFQDDTGIQAMDEDEDEDWDDDDEEEWDEDDADEDEWDEDEEDWDEDDEDWDEDEEDDEDWEEDEE